MKDRRRAGIWVAVGAVSLGLAAVAGYMLGNSGLGGSAGRQVPSGVAGTGFVSAAELDEVHPHASKQKNPDGSWKYTNRLANATSPYLLLHAHNPVDWYPWGPEALEKARSENKPIFLSVGYSTCYWCHVMERQVFSDPEIAKLMNDWFVSIKVDREERPDLDEIYMTATHLLTGSGGWPNSVFLTPDLKPFYAGTYFPPEDRYGRPGFPRVLNGLHEAWQDRREEVQPMAERITTAIREVQEGGSGAPGPVDRGLVDEAIDYTMSRYDRQNGGFGGAPKFPPDHDLELLLAEYERTGDNGVLEVVVRTLEAMARGGIHDHLGGGFHRYATDARWRVPHFEKMLYNQAQLARVYLRAYRITENELFADAARDIFRFVEDTMTSPQGGFYSALDSETDGVEGKYYLWTEEQIRRVLGGDADTFLGVYDLAPMPEGGAGVLYLSGLAGDPDLSPESLLRLRTRLLEVRRQRDRPLLDTKIIAAWNGMMIDAYATGYEVLKDDAYLQAARNAAAFVLDHLQDTDGSLLRTWREGQSGDGGYQEDYAFLIQGLLSVHRATGEPTYLAHARRLADSMIERFWDDENGGFFLSSRTDDLIALTKAPHDSAIPSGNSAATHALLSLAEATRDTVYREKARQTMDAFSTDMRKNVGAYKSMARAVHRFLDTRPDPLFGSLKIPEAPPSDSLEALVQAEVFLSNPEPAPGEVFDVRVRLGIAEGWHVNANPASDDNLVPTRLTAWSDLPVEVMSVGYPEGEELRLAFADRPLNVYQRSAALSASVRMGPDVTPGESGRLTVRIEYQLCDDARCLPPTSVERQIELTVASP